MPPLKVPSVELVSLVVRAEYLQGRAGVVISFMVDAGLSSRH
jgi:hypothetical protein